jgi:hypothetical protein
MECGGEDVDEYDVINKTPETLTEAEMERLTKADRDYAEYTYRLRPPT